MKSCIILICLVASATAIRCYFGHFDGEHGNGRKDVRNNTACIATFTVDTDIYHGHLGPLEKEIREALLEPPTIYYCRREEHRNRCYCIREFCNDPNLRHWLRNYLDVLHQNGKL